MPPRSTTTAVAVVTFAVLDPSSGEVYPITSSTAGSSSASERSVA